MCWWYAIVSPLPGKRRKTIEMFLRSPPTDMISDIWKLAVKKRHSNLPDITSCHLAFYLTNHVLTFYVTFHLAFWHSIWHISWRFSGIPSVYNSHSLRVQWGETADSGSPQWARRWGFEEEKGSGTADIKSRDINQSVNQSIYLSIYLPIYHRYYLSVSVSVSSLTINQKSSATSINHHLAGWGRTTMSFLVYFMPLRPGPGSGSSRQLR